MEIFWIEGLHRGRLTILRRPLGGERLSDEVLGWLAAGVTDVVSLLQEPEIHELELTTEAQSVVEAGLSFGSFPIPDRGVPQRVDPAVAFWARIAGRLEAGGSVGLHCRAGIGRSGLMAAGILCYLGEPEEIAWARVSKARGLQCPDTDEQKRWLTEALRSAGKARQKP